MTPESSPQDRPLVLIVDDDDTTRTMAIGYLSQAGFEVKESESGALALDMVAQRTPDLIILDVEMPNMDGFEVCEALRVLPKLINTPILMLTGLDNTEYIDKAYIAGATDFASKPINWTLLSHRLRYMHRASQAAEQLLKEQTRLDKAQRIAQMGNWNYDVSTNNTEWSDQLYRILGLVPDEIEPTIQNGLPFTHADDKDRVERWFRQIKKLVTTSTIDHRITLKDGSEKNVRQQVEPELDSTGSIVALNAIVQDFTDWRRVEKKVHQLAYYDALTSLPNRILFQEQLSMAMKQAETENSELAVLYFDLDDFKRINDSFGHAIGDKLLHEVAERLAHTLRISIEVQQPTRANDIIARMGGDEFIIILNRIASRTETEQIAHRIIRVVSEPYHVDGYELFTSPSIGIALYPKDGEQTDTLLKNADMAMYEAKRTGKSMYMVHNDDMQDKALRRYEIDTQMRSALENDEFSVHYQVQIDLETGRTYSAEALVRWQNETLGFMSPAEFIPVAEESGLIIDIGEWVLRESCKQAKAWMDEDFPVPSVAVNISVMQFMRSDFTKVVDTALKQTGLPANRLELEITESLLASDIHHAIDTLRELHELGVKLSIDDFGTGYSSLSQLKHFPIDRLKIDQSFIRNITENQHDAVITRAIIAMAQSMDIKVLAEGVETEEHLTFLRDNGCDEIQGYLISKPVSAAQLAQDMPALRSQLDAYFADGPDTTLRQAS